MKWSTHNLIWGRPLRSIFAVFDNKVIPFKFYHMESSEKIIIEQDLLTKSKKIKNFKEYIAFLKTNQIILDHNERKN